MIVDEIQNADEIQIDTKLFKSWRKKSGYQYIGKSYTNSFAKPSSHASNFFLHLACGWRIVISPVTGMSQ
jgi:hypothetical protein